MSALVCALAYQACTGDLAVVLGDVCALCALTKRPIAFDWLVDFACLLLCRPFPGPGQSKLANIMFTYEMARRLQPGNAGSSSGNITVNALHPGVVRTELSRYLIQDPDSFSGKLLTLLATPFTLSPEQVCTHLQRQVLDTTE